MAAVNEIYKCEACGSMVEVIHGGGGELKCCDQLMVLLSEKTEDQAKEKHVPVMQKVDGGVKVTVGSVEHPMEEAHFIEWIELIADGKTYRQFLKPGEKPEAVFPVECTTMTAREHCNKHGLWKSDCCSGCCCG